ncbi:Lsr2 family protein [Nakamurella flavida]|uniref:Lsr2 family protein n=2 Tax=Nakamurella flavida TaxID=363630 RepID=A0A938YJ90_9ACTN|nr:Lsr2 family protein [Nakamurella flavida]
MQETKRDLVTLDLVLPGERPQRMVLDQADFDRLITRGDVQDVLDGAEELEDDGPARLRAQTAGRAAAISSTKRDPSQIQAIRDWARQNGYQVSDRGRIKAEIEQAYQDAHQ